MDGLQTPSGVETPSGLTSVVSTVAGGLETPDFIELRKNTSGVRELGEPGGQRQLYQVVPERQTNVRGLMGSERGYDISAVSGTANVEVLGQEGRGKVRHINLFAICISTDEVSFFVFRILAQDRRGSIDRRRRTGRHVRRPTTEAVRRGQSCVRWCSCSWLQGRLLGYGCRECCTGDQEAAKGGWKEEGEGERLQVLGGVLLMTMVFDGFASFLLPDGLTSMYPRMRNMVYCKCTPRALFPSL